MTKVALCLTGKIGNTSGKTGMRDSDIEILRKGFEHYKRHIIDKNDVDIFIHCWDIEFQEEVKSLYKPIDFVFEKQRKFKIPLYVRGSERPWQLKAGRIRRQSTYSRWYSNKIANELRRNHELKNTFKYDVVMTSRFDIAFQKDIIFSQFDMQYFYAGNWDIVLNDNGVDIFSGGAGPLYDLVYKNKNILNNYKFEINGFPKNENGLLDLWFFSNSNYSTDFFNLFNNLDQYNRPGNCPLSQDQANTVSNHQLALYHLQKLNLANKIKFTFNLYDDFPLIRRKFYRERRDSNIGKESRSKKIIKFFQKVFLKKDIEF